MANEDTINILKECSAGVKMGIDSINDVLEHVSDKELKEILSKSKEMHQRLDEEICGLLSAYDESDKEPSPMAKGMSWMKTNVKISLDGSDATSVDLITDGCNMGVKSLNRYLNQYKDADEASKDIAKRLIGLEEELAKDISCYL